MKVNDSQLCCLVDSSRYALKDFREIRKQIVDEYAGNNYRRREGRKVIYLNLISLYAQIMTRHMYSSNPRAMLSTFDVSQKPQVNVAEVWLNKELEHQYFGEIMKEMAFESILSPMAMCIVALATPGQSANKGYEIDAGEPFISPLDFEDWVGDMRATRISDMQYVAWRFREPYDVVMQSSLYNKKAKDRIKPMTQMDFNKDGDERIGTIGRGYHLQHADLEDMVELWNVYIPRLGVVKTFTEDDLNGPRSAWEGGSVIALREQEWKGPECGPVHYLAHSRVPGNLLPKAPVHDVLDLHYGANQSYRKLMRQAARLKINSVCDSTNPADAEALNKANDGDTVPVTAPDRVKEVIQGGPHAGLFQWTNSVIVTFMQQAGNLLTLGGLATQAGTLGQEELLAQQSNDQVAMMQENMVNFTTRVCDAMLWYAWHNPRLVMEAPHVNPEVPYNKYTQKVYPWNGDDPSEMRRTGKKPDLKIDPYSLRHVTPQQRAKDLMSVITQVWLPMSQLAMQQGVVIKFDELMKLLAKYIDSPDLQTILTITAPPESVGNSPTATSGGSGPSPAKTTREYVRKDVGRGSMREQKMEQDNQIAAMAAAGGENQGF